MGIVFWEFVLMWLVFLKCVMLVVFGGVLLMLLL